MPTIPPVVAGLAASGPPGTVGVYIVQLRTTSLEAWRVRLEALGAEVLGYLPYSAHLVRMDPQTATRVEAEPFVRWVGIYEPSWRTASELGNVALEVPTRRWVLQTFVAGTEDKAALAAEVRAVGGRVVRQTPHGFLLEAELDGAQARALLASSHLQWIEPWSAPETDMDNGRVVSGASYVSSVGGYDGSGVRAEVMDSGILLNHQDFDGVQVHGPWPSTGAHGTATYGIVFGNGDRDGDGDARATGMMPAAAGYFADYSSLTDRYAHTAELVAPPIEAVLQSNSWGSARTLHYTAISAEMDDIVWTYDLPIFQSQSNSGDQYSRPQAWAKNVVSVGGVNHYDDTDPGNDCWCDTASIGPAADGRIKPDLVFWYDAVWTTAEDQLGLGTSYADFSGTSAATPMVAGTGGLILQMWADDIPGGAAPGATVFDRRPHAATLKALMINTAQPYAFSGTSGDMARVRQGWGVPSAAAVWDQAATLEVLDETRVLTELQHDAFLAMVAPGQPELRVTMVYTDRAGSPAAAVNRINDLSLRVVAPNGTVYWGNHGLLQGPSSTPGGAADTLNTVENVLLPGPAAGAWTIEVHADEVAMDGHAETSEVDQDYALVVAGVTSLDECRSSIPAPTGLSATPAGDNQIDLQWTGAAAEYEVWRAEGGCESPRTLLGTTAETSFSDTFADGGVLYGYLVRTRGACSSPDSACVEASTTGTCGQAPDFDGLEQVRGGTRLACDIGLAWAPAAPACGGPVAYNVYRSTHPLFVPGPSTRRASCVRATAWTDASGLAPDTTYYYIVRAEDLAATGTGPCGGREETNLVRRGLRPRSLLDTDLETGLEGWEVLVPEAPTTGEMVADDPRGTFVGTEPAQPESAASGSRCLFTGRNPNADPSRADVDDGEVVALSPVFDAEGVASARLSLYRWLFLEHIGQDPDDYLAIDASNNGGATWINLETLGSWSSGTNTWTEVSFDLHHHLLLTDRMRIRVRVSDGYAVPSVVEAAIDAIRVSRTDACTWHIFTDGFESAGVSMWSTSQP
jgi:hypothetical protein